MDVIEKCKIVSIADLYAAGNTLAVNFYIEKKKQKLASPMDVRIGYFNALENAKRMEARMMGYLKAGGFIDEK